MDWTALLAELKHRGWTQLLLAAELGVSQSSISDLSNGKTTNPSYTLGRGLQQIFESGSHPAPKPDLPGCATQPEAKAA